MNKNAIATIYGQHNKIYFLSKYFTGDLAIAKVTKTVIKTVISINISLNGKLFTILYKC